MKAPQTPAPPSLQWLSRIKHPWRLLSVAVGLTAGLILAACSMLPPQITNLVTSPTFTPTDTATPTATPTNTPTPTPTPEPVVRVQEGDHELFNGNWDKAISLYSTALDQQPNPEVAAAARFGLGMARLRGGDPTSAAGDFTQYLQAYPTDSRQPEAYFQLGVIAQNQQAWDTAIQNYQQFLTLRSGVIDSYVWERIGQCYLAAGNMTDGLKAYDQAILSDRAGGLNPLLEKKADLLQQEGDYAGAFALYDLIAKSSDSHLTLASMDILRGRMKQAEGDTDAAYAYWKHAVDTYPETYDAYQALIALIDAQQPVSELQRGIINYNAGQYQLALAAFNRYIAATDVPDAQVYWYAALSRRALNDPTGAIANFNELIQHYPDSDYWAEAWTDKAYTQWAWSDDFTGAVATLQAFVEKAPANAEAPDALLQAGRIAERQDNLAKAATIWSGINTAYPKAFEAAEGAFLAGITLYRTGDYKSAVDQFTIAATHPAATAERQAAAWLWVAKTQKLRGAAPEAAAAFTSATTADPGGYYSLRAAELQNDQAPFPPTKGYDFSFDYVAERAQAEAWLADKLKIPNNGGLGVMSGPLASDGHWARGREMWILDQGDEAKAEFSALLSNYAADPLALYQLALAFRDLGAYSQAIRAARASIDALGLTDSFAAPPFFAHLRFGPYYSDLIVPAASKYKVEPLLIYAVVRQESLFEGGVTSSATAQGLMQVIPDTGTWVANRLNWPNYQNSDLYRPYINVEFGAYYLNFLSGYLHGDQLAVLAAYNAGPGNAEKWQALSNNDPDLFLEIVRLSEPQRYIKAIYEFYEIYRSLYAQKGP